MKKPKVKLKQQRRQGIRNDYSVLKPSKYRQLGKDRSRSDVLSAKSHAQLRDMARHLDTNHDLVTSIFNSLVNNVCGAQGVQIEPMPLKKDGSLDVEVSAQITKLWHKFVRCSDIHFNQFAETQRLAARSLFRDGEFFVQNLVGKIPGLKRKNDLPFIQELIDSAAVPDYTDPSKNIMAGIQRNEWGQVTHYCFDKNRNNPMSLSLSSFATDLKIVESDYILHCRLVQRINQLRGITIIAPSLERIQDLKDYEESERIAAKTAAALVAAIKKGDAEDYTDDDPDDDRDFSFGPNQIWTHLNPGESVDILQSNRPSPLLAPFRNEMLKAVAAGSSASYSTVSRNYDGNYSARRQELVEQWQNYAVLQNVFGSQYIQPTYIEFVRICILFNLIKLNKDSDREFVDNAIYLAPVMPWIDPYKEAVAYRELVKLGAESVSNIIRNRGKNPAEIREQILKERGWTQENLETVDDKNFDDNEDTNEK